MSFRTLQEAQEHAENKMIDMMNATIAMIRPRNVVWLNILHSNTTEETKNLIAGDAYVLMAQLIKKQELSQRVMISVRMIYTDFDPDVHFGTITRDDNGRVVSFVPVKYDASLHKDIVRARDIWETCIRHRELIDGYVKSLEIFADGLWELTGTALVKSMTDFSQRTNYAIDKSLAGEIVAEIFPEETVTGKSQTESEEGKEK